jgi:3-oxochol-4-en-24-oyl-CoA dehydrogenase
MNLNLTSEQDMLRDSLEKLFSAESTMARVRAAEPLGHDPVLWGKLVEMGIPLMRAAAPFGSGLGLLDAALIAELAGRHLAACPVVETIVAARLISLVPGDASADCLKRISDGALVTLALSPAVAGEAQLVPAGAVADAIVFLQGDTLKLWSNPPRLAPAANLGCLPVAELDLAQAKECVTLASGAAAVAAYKASMEEWRLLSAAALSGLALQSLKLATDYAKERTAFGQLIGSFQGLAHPLADAFTDSDGARLLVWRAISALGHGEARAGALCAMAYWWAARTTEIAVVRAAHSFGGYGFTTEYDVQLYNRRGRAWALMAGDPRLALDDAAMRLWGRAATPALPEAGEIGIEFGYGAAAEAYAEEARQFFAKTLTPELKAHAHHSWDGHDTGFQMQLAKAGFLFPGWPKEHGGQGRSFYEVEALTGVFHEFGWTHHAIVTGELVGPTIMEFGNERVRQEIIPPLMRGEFIVSQGFTEPHCGSDAFATRTRAVRDGDDWIINGQKMFTSGANITKYVMLLTRTDTEVPKHKGLTVFMVPLDAPGVEIHPVHTISDERTNATFYADVRIPDYYRLGEVNGGIKVMNYALQIEHGGWRIDELAEAVEAAADWAREPVASGGSRFDNPLVRQRLAEIATHVEVSQCLNMRAVWSGVEKVGNPAFGPMSKLFATEYSIKGSAALMDMTAPHSMFKSTKGLGKIEFCYRLAQISAAYAGTSEIMRSLVAEKGLGLPRSRS